MILWARWRGLSTRRCSTLRPCRWRSATRSGAIGCQLSGDGDYGEPSDLPWAMAYPEGTVPTDDEVHPTPIYETLAMGLVAWVLWRLRDACGRESCSRSTSCSPGLERLLVEFVRRNDAVAAGLTTAQLQSLAMVAGGSVGLGRRAARGPASAGTRKGKLFHPMSARLGHHARGGRCRVVALEQVGCAAPTSPRRSVAPRAAALTSSSAIGEFESRPPRGSR